MSNNIICHECGTENEPQYAYCKNCGASLKPETVKQDIPNGANFNGPEYNYNTYNQSFMLEFIEGIPSQDVATFIGKKHIEILPKFNKMEITATKTSWCWPAAVLAFLFGPLGAAIWFFYRKMHKIALIFVAIGIVLGAACALISGPVADIENLKGAVENFYDGNLEDFSAFLDESIASQDTIRNSIASAFETCVNIATMIIAGIFGFDYYKKHCIKSINRYRNMSVDPRYYKMGLMSIGGTSSGMAVLGIAIMILAEDILSLISFLV